MYFFWAKKMSPLLKNEKNRFIRKRKEKGKKKKKRKEKKRKEKKEEEKNKRGEKI